MNITALASRRSRPIAETKLVHGDAAAKWRPRLRYVGVHDDDEDRHRELQLGFEREAAVLTADGLMLENARTFGPCGSHGKILGGVIILHTDKDGQRELLRDFMSGALAVTGVSPGDFDTIWHDDLGVDLRTKAPITVDLCDCEDEWTVQLRRRRFGFK